MVRRRLRELWSKAVGVNGKRAAVLDLRSTDPEEWENDVRPPLKNYADITVYEMHHRDFVVWILFPEFKIKASSWL